MTKPEFASTSETEGRDYSALKRIALASVAVLGLAFMSGVAAGYSALAFEDGGLDLIDIAILGGILAAIAAVVWALWRYWPRSSDEPEAPSVKRSRIYMYASLALGLVLGIALAVGREGDLADIFSGPVSPIVAGISIALWLIVLPIGTWLWLRTVDEHEAGAYREGAFVAVHAYVFIAPTWWIANRAGWAPPQDPMIVLLVVCVIWTLVWFGKRYL